MSDDKSLVAGVPENSGIGRLLLRVSTVAKGHLDRHLLQLGLTNKHFAVLNHVSQMGPQSQAAIGKDLQLDRTTMVGVIDDLERAALASRAPDEQDRRAYRIQITELGARWLAEARVAASQADAAFLRPLSVAERVQLRALLLKLAEG